MAATAGTVAGRPQPQTTAEPAGGPFVRHAIDGRRAMYVNVVGSLANAGFIANPMVSSPGWNKGYRIQFSATGGTSTAAGTATADAPYSYGTLVQMKDAFGTQLLTGPGFDILFLVPLYSGQFGTDIMQSPQNSPQFAPINTAATGGMNWQFSTYLPFEFAKAYGVISGANAALLPVLQINTGTTSAIFTGGTITAQASVTATVDADFYWLPNVAADPPGIGTTCQWIFQPCNPTIPSAGSQFVQLPRLGGYITGIIFDLRDSTNARVADTTTGALLNGVGWPIRPRFLVDGVPLIDTLMATWLEDLAISTQIGAFAASAQVNASGGAGALAATTGTAGVTRPTGTFWWSRKTGLSQRNLGLLDTGEIFLSTNPGTQIELGGFPWGTTGNSPMTLNVIAGQVVPSGALIRGLPEA